MQNLSTSSKNIIAITTIFITFTALCVLLLPTSFVFYFTIWLKLTLFVVSLAFYLAISYKFYTVTWFWARGEGESWA
jgi:hypothetical protein